MPDFEERNKLKRAVVFSDLSGFSKCALSVAIPVLSAQKIEVLPVPTAVLSANMSIPGFLCVDSTDYLGEYLNHWKNINIRADGVYSGYLNAPGQARLVEEAIGFLKPALVLVDPVMGDNGRLYKSANPLMKDAFQRLIEKADVFTPNLTEACLLTNTEYGGPAGAASIEDICKKLCALGAKNVVITGVARENALYNCVMENGCYSEFGGMELPYKMGGTGDLFASVLMGRILNGAGLSESVRFAAGFVADVMSYTVGVEDYKRRGICFEPFLHRL